MIETKFSIFETLYSYFAAAAQVWGIFIGKSFGIQIILIFYVDKIDFFSGAGL